MKMPVIGDHHQIHDKNIWNHQPDCFEAKATWKHGFSAQIMSVSCLLVTVPWTYPAKTLHYGGFENLGVPENEEIPPVFAIVHGEIYV